ncbi:MAG: LOG family protein [Terriglobia bacterium]
MIVVTVFGSSRPAPGSPDYETACALGAALARAGFTLCTGGYGGTMEGVSRGAREAGGHTIGVTAESFRAPANAWVAEEVRVKSWEERLFELIRRGEGYVVLPGGTGTLAELAVVWEMLNKGFLARKPLVVLGDFWRAVLEVIEQKQDAAHLVLQAESPQEAATLLQTHLREGGSSL